MIKQALKKFFLGNAWSSARYELLRARYHQLRKLKYYWSDIAHVYRHMRWRENGNISYSTISAELFFQFHKLEKGLCMPGARRFFGYEPATATMNLLDVWDQENFPRDDPVYQGAKGALRAYKQRLIELDVKDRPVLFKRLEGVVNGREAHAYATPIAKPGPKLDSGPWLSNLMSQRRSVREFVPSRVVRADLEHAIALAQLSPSACNRQPWHVHIFQDKNKIDELLKYQNGNRGFGQVIYNLLIVTVDSGGFFDASERHQGYVDGGLFSMSLLLALESMGIASCCLNWCVDPLTDRQARASAAIPDRERIVMYIAIGHAVPNVSVPLSARRATQNITHWH